MVPELGMDIDIDSVMGISSGIGMDTQAHSWLRHKHRPRQGHRQKHTYRQKHWHESNHRHRFPGIGWYSDRGACAKAWMGA